MASIVFWPLVAGLAYVVLLVIAWWLLLSHVSDRDDDALPL